MMFEINELVILLNNYCNLRCSYCNFREDRPKYFVECTPERVKKAIQLFLEQPHIPKSKDNVLCFNADGEALLSIQLLLEAIEYALELKKQLSIEHLLIPVVTNATLVDRKIAAEFARLGVVVTVSLDGDAEVHNQHRFDVNRNPSHQRAVRGIRYFQEMGVPVSLRAVVTPETISQIKESYKFLKGLHPARPLKMRPMRSKEDTFTPEWVEEFNLFFVKMVEELVAEGIPIEELPDDAIHFGKFITEGSYRQRNCGAGEKMLWMAPTGEFTSCGLFTKEPEILGHIDNLTSPESLSQLLKQPHASTLRNCNPKHFDPVCSSCEWVKVCQGGCAAYPLKPNGSQYHHPPLCSFYMNLGKTLKKQLI